MAAGVKPPPYTRDILRLAASIPHLCRLEQEDGAVELRSPTCGSRIRMGYRSGDGVLSAIGVEVEVCAYGQAATCLMARHAAGTTVAQAKTALSDLQGWLDGVRGDPGDWPDLALLEPGRGRMGRHGAILLPFRALVAALEEIS